MDLLYSLLLFLLGAYSLLVTIRVLLQYFRISPSNPVSQAVINATDPTLRPLRRLTGQVRNIDLSAVLVCIILETLQNVIKVGVDLSCLLAAPVDFLANIAKILIALLIVRIIFSFIPVQSTGWTSLIVEASNVVLRPFRNFPLQIGPIDLTPGLVLLMLFFVNSFLMNIKISLLF